MALKKQEKVSERGKKVGLPKDTEGIQEPLVDVDASAPSTAKPKSDDPEDEGGRTQPLPSIASSVSVEDQLRDCANRIQGIYNRLGNAANQTHVDAIRIDLIPELDKIRELSGQLFENL